MSKGLILKDISKRFGDFWALRQIRATVPAGRITAFIGPNGAGKTTTIKMLLGLLFPSSGKAEVLGKPGVEWQRLAGAADTLATEAGKHAGVFEADGRLVAVNRPAAEDMGVIAASLPPLTMTSACPACSSR